MGVYSGAEISEEGLVLCLDAANPRSYGGSGTTWSDLSGRGHDGTLVNNTSLSGNVMSFDGVDDHVLIGTHPDYNSLSNLTIESIVKFKRDSTYEYVISNARDCCGTYYGFELRRYTTTKRLRFTIWNSGSVQINNNTDLELEQFYHIACTYDGQQMKMYLNSRLDRVHNTTYGIGSPASFNLRVGAMGAYPQYELQGEIGLIKIYNRALSAQEVEQNFKATRGRFGL